MARDDEDEDLDLTTAKPSKKKLLIMIAVVALLLLAAAIAGFFLLSGSDDEIPGDEAVTEETAQSAAEQVPPQYYAMDPAFIVNLPGDPSLLQVGIIGSRGVFEQYQQLFQQLFVSRSLFKGKSLIPL